MLQIFNTHRKFFYIAIAAIAILILLRFMWRAGDAPNEADRIYTNVYIHEVAVGGMNMEEANAALMERFQPALESRMVRYAVGADVLLEFTFAEFGAKFDFSPTIETALMYTHAPRFSQRVTRIFRDTYKITDSPTFIFSAEMLEDVLIKISQEIDIPVRNAAFREEGGEISVTGEHAGQGVDTVLAAEATQEILRNLTDGTIQLQIITVAPSYTTANFDFAPTLLGAFETPCACKDDPARCRNIVRAAERIHNTVVYPGGVFSAGEKIGAHLPNSGYEAAVVLIQGQPAEDIGGGVCQVVTTLYNAVLRSELEVVQRHNHSARVSYVDIGYDATVAGDYYDLKFKNNTGSPILVTSGVKNDSLHVRIYGNETREDGRSVRFEGRQVELLTPEPYREIVDPSVPLGSREVTLPSQMGYHVELFKIVYMYNEPIEEIKVNTSVYKPLQGIIAIGAG